MPPRSASSRSRDEFTESNTGVVPERSRVTSRAADI